MNNYPIILAHGIARFDFLVQRFSKDLGALGSAFGLADNELHYFKGVARHLRNNGFEVYQSSVGFSAGVERRAADLKREIETFLATRSGVTKVHIIAHSMGGLDARHLIVNHQMANTIASLTTIGTPHLGTSFADWGFNNRGHFIIELLGNMIDLGGFADLTTAACRAFNQSAEPLEAANPVFYQTYRASENKNRIFAPLQSAWEIINNAEGENDGLVSRASQAWKGELVGADGVRKQIPQHEFPVSADHLNEIGWWDLNQLQFTNLFNTNLFSEVKNYETKIKNVYLDIARFLQTLP